MCLPYEPHAQALTQPQFIFLRLLLLIVVVVIATTLGVATVAQKYRTDTRTEIRATTLIALLLLTTGMFYIASFIGYFDQYWQLRDALPLIFDAWREPWAKWSPAYVISGLCLTGFAISQAVAAASARFGRVLLGAISIAVLILVLPTLRPVPIVEGLQAPTPKELEEVVNEASALVELLPPDTVCVGNINGRQDLTQLTGMTLADRGASVLFATPDRVCSDQGLPVVLLNRNYPNEVWAPFYGQDTYREGFTPVAQGQHMALLQPNS
jgi:hypothetical protein